MTDLSDKSELPRLLRTSRLGRDVRCLDEVDSTNRVARDLAENGAAEGTLVVADSQTAGRGRLQRAWYSPPGRNLYLSLVLRPATAPADGPQVALVAGLALARAARREVAEVIPTVKWPNDLFIDDRKAAGILCEMGIEGRGRHFLVLGVGVNVNVAREELTPAIAETATSLRIAAGREIDRARLLAAFLNEFEPLYDLWQGRGLEPLLELWAEFSFLNGRPVTVQVGRERVSGSAEGITRAGALRIRTIAGAIREVRAGDVHVLLGGRDAEPGQGRPSRP